MIGIIAALTIPNLMGAYKKRVVETELKKSYTELAQVIQRSEVDNEAAIYWNWPYNGGMTGSLSDSPDEFFQRYFAPYMKILHSEKSGQKNYLIYDSTGNRSFWGNADKNYTKWYDLSDGRSFRIDVFTLINGDFTESKKGSVGRFYISTTNRKGGKFVIGKNLFSFALAIKNGNLVPTVTDYASHDCVYLKDNRDKFIERCKSDTSAAGIPPTFYCTLLIYCNNWKVPDDYPIKF